MKQIAFYCVNYHSYERLYAYLESIDTATMKSGKAVNVTVFIADNSLPASGINYEARYFTLQTIESGENKGYFGAIQMLMTKHPPFSYHYSIISNVDVLLDSDFFTQLLLAGCSKDTGWLAPQIYSQSEQRDRNPKITSRYSKRKLQVLRFLFRYPPLYNIYTHTVYKSKKLARHEPGTIYAGHGSFIILTKSYFQRCGLIDYPVFLFCEEIYLGEQCLQHQLKVMYEPTIKVTDAEHVSTGTFKRSKYCRLNYKAISFILEHYYK